MSGHGNWRAILRLQVIQKWKRCKWLYYCKRFEKSELTTFLERRKRNDLIETFKIINEISNYGRHFFNISPRTKNLLWRQILKIKCTNQLDLFSNHMMHFWNNLPYQIKNDNSVESYLVELDDFRNNSKENYLRGHFWRLSDVLR